MDGSTIDQLKHAINVDVVRKLLIKYFREKGFNETFDRLVYPSLLQDMAMAIPVMTAKLEIEPHAVEVDPNTGKAVLGWNLFVLGSHRMYLGETFHRDLSELAREIQAGVITVRQDSTAARHRCTPRQIINFICRVLSKHEGGYVDLAPGAAANTGMNPYGGASAGNAGFYSRSGYGTA